ncbi:lysylphosphatidylglycerol synthase domain-containing protein [Xanthobacter sp. VNH20]|uniref:lysylphosphatidylglycerol synthase domain-containing protein n=1 Tax=Xanthobacter sp. VNH20 TaxID=3156616 RepID=UPI0032B3160C
MSGIENWTEKTKPLNPKVRRTIGLLRRYASALLGVAMTALAIFLLYRMLRGYSAADLAAAMAAVSWPHIAGSFIFAAGSYFCLTLFDYFGLHYAGKPLPYRKAALASFVSLSLGHTIGLAALSSGTVRYRYYARWGLGIEEIAKVILFCGVTVGLGLAALAAIALIAAPASVQRITGLSGAQVAALAGACLLFPCVYAGLAAVARKEIRLRAWSFTMPSLGLAIAQILVGTLNFACVAACLHQALTGISQVDFASTVSAYVAANVATLITHVPGGLGVVETVVQHLLPSKNIIGPLLVFRFAYFLVPLALGAILLAISEAMLETRRD